MAALGADDDFELTERQNQARLRQSIFNDAHTIEEDLDHPVASRQFCLEEHDCSSGIRVSIASSR